MRPHNIKRNIHIQNIRILWFALEIYVAQDIKRPLLKFDSRCKRSRSLIRFQLNIISTIYFWCTILIRIDFLHNKSHRSRWKSLSLNHLMSKLICLLSTCHETWTIMYRRMSEYRSIPWKEWIEALQGAEVHCFQGMERYQDICLFKIHPPATATTSIYVMQKFIAILLIIALLYRYILLYIIYIPLSCRYIFYISEISPSPSALW